jgi:hypothetical protein
MTIRDKGIIKFFIVAALVALSSLFAYAASDKVIDIGLAYEIDNDEVHIGDRISLELTAAKRNDVDIIFPDQIEDPGEFTFIESFPLRSTFGNLSRTGRTYVVSIYTTGTHVIPPISVKYKKKNDDQWSLVESPQVPIEVKSLLAGDDKDIKDLKGLISFGMDKRTIVMIFLLLLAAGVIILAIWLRKRHILSQEEAARNRTADEIAYEELRALRAMDLPAKALIKEYYIRLSDIVRRYLENRFSFRAPEMTTEEFLETLRESSLLSVEHKSLLREFLSHCDMVKFAKYGPTDLEMLDSFQAAERLVDQTREIRKEAAE